MWKWIQTIQCNMRNGYSFWDLLKIRFNSITKSFVFLKITFNWVVDDGKDNLNIKKTGELSMHKQKTNTKDTEISGNWYYTHRLHMYIKITLFYYLLSWLFHPCLYSVAFNRYNTPWARLHLCPQRALRASWMSL